MGSAEVELFLTAIAAMLSPTTLTFSVLALVLGERPIRTGTWFYLGALGATLLVGVVAAFALEDIAAAPPGSSQPKTWVAILDLVLGALALFYSARLVRKPMSPESEQKMVDKVSGLASSPAIAVIGAGAALANPGGFIPIALKDISQLNPDAGEYIVLVGRVRADFPAAAVRGAADAADRPRRYAADPPPGPRMADPQRVADRRGADRDPRRGPAPGRDRRPDAADEPGHPRLRPTTS